jgi:hypothetical protein
MLYKRCKNAGKEKEDMSLVEKEITDVSNTQNKKLRKN